MGGAYSEKLRLYMAFLEFSSISRTQGRSVKNFCFTFAFNAGYTFCTCKWLHAGHTHKEVRHAFSRTGMETMLDNSADA